MFLLSVAAWARSEGTALVVEVYDPSGAPIPTAVVRFPAERERHRVSTSGSWKGTMLYLPDGTELIFDRHMQLEVEVLAPGYRPQLATHTVRGGRTDRLELVLEPMDLTVPPDAPAPARATLETLAEWQQLAHAPLDELYGIRSRTRQHAEAWLQWQRETGTEDPRAVEICRLAHDHPEHCEP